MVGMARTQGASDLHFEAGLPAALRIRGSLRVSGEPVPARQIAEAAQALIGPERWPSFLERRSFDLSRTINGVRCRINVMHTSRGVGMAIRLLAPFQATIEKLNLHTDLKKLVTSTHGLVLVSGPTGCGKSSTLAALIQEINLTEACHIVTLESPIEYTFKPRKAYIRQREVGRDTPGFEQGLLDALREDPDVLMVGEMRDAETMRLTLGASETGHLVLATVHSSTCTEALQRVVSAFPSEIQSGVAAQLADSLVAVISQRLRFRPELNMRLPECEILMATHAVKNFIRNRDFFKIISSIETGADHGMWSFQRYRTWMDNRSNWYSGAGDAEPPEADGAESPPILPMPSAAPSPSRPVTHHSGPTAPHPKPASKSADRIEIEPIEEGAFGKILKPPGK
jgi:twitching motility protein PilT